MPHDPDSGEQVRTLVSFASERRLPVRETLFDRLNPVPWNKGKLTGQKPPPKLREIWAIRFVYSSPSALVIVLFVVIRFNRLHTVPGYEARLF